MKKVILFFSVLFLSTTLAFGQPTATLSVPDLGEQSPGSVFFPITLDATSGDVFGTFQFFFAYDPTVLQPVGDWAASPAATGIVYNSPLFPFYEWLNNTHYVAGGGGESLECILTWLSFTGTVVPGAGEVLVTMEFDYMGGYSDFAWQYTTTKGPGEEGWDEKGMTGLWTFAGTPFELTTIDGSVGIPPALGWNWNGSVSTDWFDGNNWDEGTYPDGTADVTIPAGMPNDPWIVTNDVTPEVAVAPNLISDAPITVGPLGYLSVFSMFTNNGGLTVLSDNTYSGSFIYDAALAGNFQYDRYVSGDAGDEYGWHYISAITPGFTTDDMNDYWVNAWDEATGMWMNYGYDPILDPCTPWPTTPLNTMDGWSVKFDAAYPYPICPGSPAGTGNTLEFVGAPNFGDQVGAATAGGAGMYPGFNLVGNPYPSYFDYDAYFFGANWTGNLMDAIYFYDADMAQYASYVGGIGTNGGSNYVPPGQAFFVEALLPDALTFTTAEQAHVYNVPFWKDATDLVRLMATTNDRTDETVIHFNENSTVNRDNNDARKMMSTATAVPSLYTMADNMAISINGMPATPSVPVFFECATTGSVTIDATETSEFAHVVLEDLLTGIQTDLLAGSYTFDHIAGADADRFILHFTPLGVGDNFADMVNIWSNQDNIYVQVPNVTGDIIVFNMMGQEVVRTDIEAGLNIIPMSSVNTYYVVKVLTSDNAVTGKVFIK